MAMWRRIRRQRNGTGTVLGILALSVMMLGTCTTATPGTPTPDSNALPQLELTALQDVPVPALPFDDNPDPAQCGIPIRWGQDDPAWLTGFYEGKLVEPMVHLYNGHWRSAVTGLAPHGSRVQVILFQQNPVLNYYLVRTLDLDIPQEGWVPAPFLSFEPARNTQP